MQQNEKPGRRIFLTAGAATLGGAALALAGGAEAAPSTVARLADVQPGKPVSFNYPGDEPAYLVDLGRAVAGGIGPKRSIVAYSALCQHMGCPVNYDDKTGHLVCPCHASRFDPAMNGDAVEGPSTRGLPRIRLRLSGDAIQAVGIEQGVVYGRACNQG